MSLKLIGRIALKEIIDSLVNPIFETLDHIESFVRCNSVECIHRLYVKFGKELLPDVEDRIVKCL